MKVVFVVVILLMGFVAFDLYNTITRNRREMEAWKVETLCYRQQFEDIKVHMDEVRAFQHDYRNHLSVLYSLLGPESDEAKRYISSIWDVSSVPEQYSKTGNVPVDSIINIKLSKAREYQVELETDIMIPEDLQIEPVDIVVILGNLLDNAINACLRMERDRKIDFHLVYQTGMLEISMENTYNGIIIYKDNRMKTISGNEWDHGYGLKNVEAALKKYNGYMKVFHDNHIFRVVAIMYV